MDNFIILKSNPKFVWVLVTEALLSLLIPEKHNSEHRVTIMSDNVSPLSNSTSALFEV